MYGIKKILYSSLVKKNLGQSNFSELETGNNIVLIREFKINAGLFKRTHFGPPKAEIQFGHYKSKHPCKLLTNSYF